MRPSLPQRENPLLHPNVCPTYEDLLKRRRLGRTTLAVDKTKIGTSNATMPENLGPFEYAHLRAPLPKDLKGSEIFTKHHQNLESYFLMRRSRDGHISATGMFKIAFPWAKQTEEAREREHIKSRLETSEDEIAGNIWISPEFALELGSEYNMLLWVRALLDPTEITQGADSEHINAPPKYDLPPLDDDTLLSTAPPPVEPRRSRRSASPTKSSIPGRKIATPRKSRQGRAQKESSFTGSPSVAAGLSLQNTLDDVAASIPIRSPKKAKAKAQENGITPESEEEEEEGEEEDEQEVPVKKPNVTVTVESTVDATPDMETTRTNVFVQMPAGVPELPLPEDTEKMIATAKEMVEEATKLQEEVEEDGEPITDLAKKRKAGDLADIDEDEEDANSPDGQAPKRAKLLEDRLKRERVRNRALIGVTATLAVANVMSLPGLELSQPTVEGQHAPVEPIQHSLPQGSEWRFEVAYGNTVRVKLLSGTAELFGTELAPSQTYTFSGTKAAIYTWHGCTLEVVAGDPVSMGGYGNATAATGPDTGGCQVEYTAEETPMVEYANVHFGLETMRDESKAAGREGPRVLILGPDDAGKTSLAKILTGYATKMGRQPFVVNIDPAEGMLSLPGTLTATGFRTLIDIEQGWGTSPLSGPTPVPVKLPLVYFYGLKSPLAGGAELYKALLSRLALAVSGRLSEDAESREAGIIIDTPGEISQGRAGEDVIHHIVTEFSINTILVLGSERLFSTMAKNYDGKPIAKSPSASSFDERITVVKLPKSGGCVDRDAEFMKTSRESQIRSYFFGPSVPSTAASALSLASPSIGTVISLSPLAQQVDFDSLAIYRYTIGDDEDNFNHSIDDASFLPGGSNDHIDEGSVGPPGLSTTSGLAITGSSSMGLSPKSMPLKRLPSSTEAPPPQTLENTILAITHASPNAPSNEIRDASIMGFLYVASVDTKKAKLRLLSPVAGRMPSKAIIWGRKWPGEVIGLVG
ncbi:Cleavage polyadenylation factor subunit clp1 [Myotisia sp. PD_48]|nr:Cleavage polyadenylation factor subunit clp1 [Myotisia sp. PD_48]